MYEDNLVREMMASIPKGFGVVAVQFTNWDSYSDFELYKVSAGTVLPDGKELSSGECARYEYTHHARHEKLYSFFQDYRNMLGWTKLDSFILETRFA